jgi:hypothetical protein
VQVSLGNQAVSESSLPAPTHALLTQNLSTILLTLFELHHGLISLVAQ